MELLRNLFGVDWVVSLTREGTGEVVEACDVTCDSEVKEREAEREREAAECVK